MTFYIVTCKKGVNLTKIRLYVLHFLPLPRPSIQLPPLLSLHRPTNVVFEEIGQMSVSTFYIHLSITVDLESLEEQINEVSKYMRSARL